MKVCCIGKLGGHCSCAECAEFKRCAILQDFYGKNGYKYKKYQESAEFIRAHGRAAFVQIAEKWNGPYGRLN
jgi:hypothetical protein